MGIKLYRLIELIDGEKGLQLIPYRIGQKVKMFLLIYIINIKEGR